MISQVKDVIRWHTTVWFTSLFLCSKRWKFPMDKDWKKLETIPAWQFEQDEGQKRRLFWKHKEIRNVLHKWHPGSTVFLLTSRKIAIAKCACEPRWQGFFADTLAKQHLKQKSFGTRSCHSMDTTISVQDKNFRRRERVWESFSGRRKTRKSCTLDNSLEFGKSCENLSWNHRTLTPHRSESNGSAERAVRRKKERTSPVLLQSALDEKWWAGSSECCCYLRIVQDLLADGETLVDWRFGETIKRPSHSVWCNGWTSSDFCEGPVEPPPICQESFALNMPQICICCEENLERTHSGRRHWGFWRTWTRQKSIIEKSQCKRSIDATMEWTSYYQRQMV